MSLYSIFSERRNYNPNPYTVTRNKLKPVAGDVTIEGSRAVDNAKFIVASPVDIQIGDTVSFVADDVDTEELIGAWNFYHNLRDESGYNFDGVVTSGSLAYKRETTTGSRFRGHQYLDFANSSSPVITITPSTSENNSTIINFDSDSAIALWCRVPSLNSGESQIIFDRSDSGNGLKIGVQNSGGTYYAFVQVKGSGGSWATSTLNTNVQTALGETIMIGVEKFSNNQYRISINGTNFWNYAVYAGDIEQSSPPPINIGVSSSGSNKFEGRLYSLRMYSKTLSSSDYTTMFKRKQPFTTMKFAGKVTSVDDGNSVTRIEVSGFSSELLLKTELTAAFASNIGSSANISDGVYNYRTGGTTSEKEETLLENIVSDIISAVNSNVLDSDDIKYEFVYDNVDDEDDAGGSNSWRTKSNQFHVRNIRKLVASGKLHSLTQILAILGGKEYNVSSPPTLIHNNGADSFYMLPRKVLIFESSSIDSNTKFSMGNYNILDGGYSSASIWNDVSVFGKMQTKTKTVSFSSIVHNSDITVDLDSIFSGNQKPIAVSQLFTYFSNNQFYRAVPYATSSSDDHYNIDENLVITYNIKNTSVSTLVCYVEYVDLTNNVDALTSAPTEDAHTYYYQKQNDESIEKYGKRSKKVHYPMLEDMTTTGTVCRRLLGTNAEKQRKAQIIIPHLSNSVQIGSKVSVTNDMKSIYGEELTVKSINYKFPTFKTIVNVGDYNYNFLDNISNLFDTVNLQESERTGVVANDLKP